MNEKTLKALIDAGAIKKIRIIAEGSTIYVEVISDKQTITAQTLKGKLKAWRTLDSAAKWVKSLGAGKAELNIARWRPEQRGMQL